MNFWNNPENNNVKILLLAVVILGSLAFVTGYTGSNDSNLVGGVFKGAKKSQTENPRSNYQTNQNIQRTLVVVSGDQSGDCTVFTQNDVGNDVVYYGSAQYTTDGNFVGCLVGTTLWTPGPGVVIYQGNPYDPDMYPTSEAYIDYIYSNGIEVSNTVENTN